MRRFAVALGLIMAVCHSASRTAPPDGGRAVAVRGEPVQAGELRLRFRLPAGMIWPAGVVPEVYGENLRDKAQLSWQPMNRHDGEPDVYSAGVRSIGPAEFAARLSTPGQPFYVAVFAPGFLRFFERGPFKWSEVKEGPLEIALEKPGLLEIRFDAGETSGKNLPFDRQMLTVMRMTTRNKYLWAAYRMDLPLGAPLRIADLDAGHYWITASTHPKAEVKTISGTVEQPVNPGWYHENVELHLAPDQTRRIDFHYAPPDPQAFRGQRTAVVRLRKRDGQPAKGVKVSIGYRDGHYGTIPVFAAPVPESGEIVLKGITDRVSQCLWFHRGYTVKIGEHPRDLGTFQFQTRSAPETFTFLLPPEVGDMAPDIDLVSVTTGKHTKLSNLRGELVCLDFWLSWCPYCQETIEKLDRASAQNRDHWNDRVTVVPISIDEEPDSVARHLKERGWKHLEHYWAGPWKSYPLDTAPAVAFGLDFAPKTFLIGADGRILWRGHPLAKVSGKDIVERIEETLKLYSHGALPATSSTSSVAPKERGANSSLAGKGSSNPG
jgi:thiol-disulfide isomerase/thioredoxin